jgi:segregation and condensation protein A
LDRALENPEEEAALTDQPANPEAVAAEPVKPAEPARAPEQAAEKLEISGEIVAKCPSVAEASVDSVGVMRGLKPPPPSGSRFSAACETAIAAEPVAEVAIESPVAVVPVAIVPAEPIPALPLEVASIQADAVPAEPVLAEPAVDSGILPAIAAEPVAEPSAPLVIEPEPAPELQPNSEPIAPVATAAEPVPAAEPEPQPIPASQIEQTPAAEPPAESAAPSSTVAEPALPAEAAPPLVPVVQPPAKLKTRDNEADLSPFSVIVDQVYDGPLDLLLDLIRKQDIDIYDIPIAKITAQFLAYVNQLKATDMDVAGEFIYTASLLIHIKSKMLLPRAASGPEDAAEDPRRELVERLLEHERFKNAAQMLQQKQMLEAATWSNPGLREFKDDAEAEPEIAADTVDLVRIFREILERARKRPAFNVEEDSVTVGQMIQFLGRRLTMEDKPVALRRLLSHTRSERALIAMFLALLELVRMQAILLRQDLAFSEIFVKKQSGFDAVMNEGLANARDDWR